MNGIGSGSDGVLAVNVPMNDRGRQHIAGIKGIGSHAWQDGPDVQDCRQDFGGPENELPFEVYLGVSTEIEAPSVG